MSKHICCDIECDSLDPTVIHCIVTKDIDTGTVLRWYGKDQDFLHKFKSFAVDVDEWIGHNFLAFDGPVLNKFIPGCIDYSKVTDTLILSKLVNQAMPGGHSLKAWGLRLCEHKGDFTDFESFSMEMLEYCVQDVEVTHQTYKRIKTRMKDNFDEAIRLEHDIAIICNQMSRNGFYFNYERALEIYIDLLEKLKVIDDEIHKAYPFTLRFKGVVVPRLTMHGTLARTNLRFAGEDLTGYTEGAAFSRIQWDEFNPASNQQVIDKLWKAGWKPFEKTKGHTDALKKPKGKTKEQMARFKFYGWKINEENLSTLPVGAPKAAHSMVRRIIYDSRRSTLEEWFNALNFEIEIENKECQENVKIKKENTDENGLEIKELLIRNGERKNRPITDLGFGLRKKEKRLTEKEEQIQLKLKKIENTKENTTENLFLKREEKESITYGLNINSHLKATIQYLSNKNLNVLYVRNKNNSWLITVTNKGMSGGCYVDTVTHLLDGLKTGSVLSKSISTRIRGTFDTLGTWTHRTAHRKPNMGNIAAEKSLKYHGEELSEIVKYYGKSMRQLWIAPKGKVLVGCDAAGIQLRVLAHYINDETYTKEVLDGDVHSANQKALGSVCKTRDMAKTFIYAWLLGAGTAKIAEILDCTLPLAKQATNNFIEAYPGLKRLKGVLIKNDAKRGYFEGFDGRYVICPNEHKMLAGYLQNGEAIVVKLAIKLMINKMSDEGLDFKLINYVHDEVVIETTHKDSERVGEIASESFTLAGEQLNLNCPMGGDYAIGETWYDVH